MQCHPPPAPTANSSMSSSDHRSPTALPSTQPESLKTGAVAQVPASSSPPQAVLDTPSRRCFECIRQLYEGQPALSEEPPNGVLQFHLLPAQWIKLENVILGSDLAAWFESKLRYSYDSTTEYLTFSMDTFLHACFIGDFVSLLQAKLSTIRNDNNTPRQVADAIRSLRFPSTPSIRLGRVCKRKADITVVSDSARWPALVGEVAYTQDGRNKFRPIAEQYVFLTKGKIKTFIGFDIEYRRPADRLNSTLPQLRASYSIFRLVFDEDVAALDGQKEVLFHGANGVVAPSESLRFTLSDLFSGARPDLDSFEFHITHQELANLLTVALNDQTEADQSDAEERARSESTESSFKAEWTGKRPLPPDADQGFVMGSQATMDYDYRPSSGGSGNDPGAASDRSPKARPKRKRTKTKQ